MGKKWVPNFGDMEWTTFVQTLDKAPSFAANMAASIRNGGLSYLCKAYVTFALAKNVETGIPGYLKWP